MFLKLVHHTSELMSDPILFVRVYSTSLFVGESHAEGTPVPNLAILACCASV